jgi:UDP-GlcNAc:undecaprenyl-phosphate GlcNAc-1-phosphate transferase
VLWSLIPVALIAATYGLVFVDASRRAALAAGWFDRPNERVGGPAYRCIPRLGGAGVVVSVLACIIPIAVGAAGFDAGFVTAALIPAAIAGIVGIVDDIRGVPAAVKAFALLGLGIWSWYSGLAIGILPESTPAAISAVVTVCWFVAVPTAVNFVDGLDGLAAGLTVIASAVLSLLGILVGDTTVTIVALTVGAATAGFWWHNRHPARIFMGDGGAMFLGYLLAGLAARTTAGEAGLGIEVAVVLGLMIPLADFASAMLRRTRTTSITCWHGSSATAPPSGSCTGPDWRRPPSASPRLPTSRRFRSCLRGWLRAVSSCCCAPNPELSSLELHRQRRSSWSWPARRRAPRR